MRDVEIEDQVASRRKIQKIALEMPADVYRDLKAYAELLTQEEGQAVIDPTKLIVPMLKRLMATDRTFDVVTLRRID